MKPAASPTDGRAGAPAAGGANAPVGDTPPPAAQGRGRGRGGSGFASSEVTPLVINGTMYLATPYYRVVAIDATTGKEAWTFQLPSGNPSTRGVEYWPGDAQTPPQIVFGSSDARLYSLDAKTGKPNEAFGDKGAVDLNTPEILQGLPGRDGLIVSAHRLQEPRDHRRDDPGESAERAGRRRPRVGHAHGEAGLDVPVRSARRRQTRRHVGRRQLEEPFRRERLGIPHGGRQPRDRLHALRSALGGPVRRRSAGRQPVRQQHRRGRCEHGQVSVAFPGRASRPVGRGSGGIGGPHRRQAGWQDDPSRRRHR